MKDEILSELKQVMSNMIEMRFKELEAVVQARLSVLDRPSECMDLPGSMMSELCLKMKPIAPPRADLMKTAFLRKN